MDNIHQTYAQCFICPLNNFTCYGNPTLGGPSYLFGIDLALVTLLSACSGKINPLTYSFLSITSNSNTRGNAFQTATIATIASFTMPVDHHMSQLCCCTIGPSEYMTIYNHASPNASTNC